MDFGQPHVRRNQAECPVALLSLAAGQIDDCLDTHEAFKRICVESLAQISHAVVQCLMAGGKVLLFGNGGSAADAQHIAAELVGRFRRERDPMPALALTANSSTVTAIANDFGFEEIFARQVAALAHKRDIAIGISTSGNSPNVLRGIWTARELGLGTIGFTGSDGGGLVGLAEHCLCVPSNSTARIQECHILAGHVVAEACERSLIERGAAATEGS